MLVSLAALVVDQLELRRTSLVMCEAVERADASEARAAQRGRQDTVLLATLVEGVVVQDIDGAILDCNDSAADILGVSVDELTGLTSLDPRWQAIDEDGQPMPGERHPAMRCLHDGVAVRDVTFGLLRPDGQLTWLLANSAPIFDAANEHIERIVTGFADITARRIAEDELRHLSTHDPLTGLANRAHLDEQLVRAMTAAASSRRPVEVMYLDSAATRMLLTLNAPFQLTVGLRQISASIGTALSDPTVGPAELLARADTAMYAAKAAGKNQIAKHQPVRRLLVAS